MLWISFLVGPDRWGGGLFHFVWGDRISSFVETALAVFATGLRRFAADPLLLVGDRRRSGLMATWGQHIVDAAFIFDGGASLSVVVSPFSRPFDFCVLTLVHC